MDWDGHWHGYKWVGSGEDYFKEPLRRPTFDNSEKYKEFLHRTLPPMMTGHWLLKKRQTSQQCTWTDEKLAVAWLEQQYDLHPPLGGADNRSTYVGLDVLVPAALDRLPRGVDVTWAHWLQASRTFGSFSVVACANRFHPKIPCPLPPM